MLLGGCGTEHDTSWIEAKYSNPSSHFVTIDGNRVHYRDEGQDEGLGEETAEVIILLHGTASSLHTWDSWSHGLKDKYRIVRMDLPGFGLTGPDVNNRYEVSDDVKFLSAFMQKLGISSAHMAGSSLGGRIAWQYALDFPDQVQSLTLINALGYPQAQWPPAIEMGQWPVVDKIMAHFSPRFMYEIGLKEVYFNKALVSDQLVDRYFELSRYPGNMAAFPRRVKASLDQDSSLISQIKVPTLILWGEEDRYFPVASAYQFKKDISGAQLYVYPGVGHLPMEEVPQRSMKNFYEFITGLVQLDLTVSSSL
jgi:pimeloyl-ACP methyl ester carboxylesterase